MFSIKRQYFLQSAIRDKAEITHSFHCSFYCIKKINMEHQHTGVVYFYISAVPGIPKFGWWGGKAVDIDFEVYFCVFTEFRISTTHLSSPNIYCLTQKTGCFIIRGMACSLVNHRKITNQNLVHLKSNLSIQK